MSLILFIIILCLLLSAFFSAAEAAFAGASKAHMAGLVRKGSAHARQALRILEQRERFLATMRLGNIIVSIGMTVFAVAALGSMFEYQGVLAGIVIIGILFVILAEALPKRLAGSAPDRIALRMVGPASVSAAVLGPLVSLIELVARGLLRLFGVKAGAAQPVLSASEEIRGQLAILHRQGGVVKDERDMLGGLLDLKELFVSDVMVHRTKVESIDADLPPGEILREVVASAHTRLPLWRETSENIVGVLHSKDLLQALSKVGGDIGKLDIAEIALETWFVPENTTLQDQLKLFLAKKSHFALVVDEYGEVMGLVTLEDILEEIVGDIADEHDLTVEGVRMRRDGSVIVDGSVPIRDLNRVMDWRLPDDEATTIAGLVIHEARQIPNAGQTFIFHGYRFQILKKSRNRLNTLLVAKLQKPAS